MFYLVKSPHRSVALFPFAPKGLLIQHLYQLAFRELLVKHTDKVQNTPTMIT